jgi:endonuclease/exonuclease/phosphatase family metal-dependent hydrolase
MIRISAIGLILFLLPLSSQSQDSLKLLSWNIQMLPRGLGKGKAKRAKAIVEELRKTNHDVVVFQELFYARSRKILSRGLKETFPHQTPVLNKKIFSFKLNGGVMIFSKYPITGIKEICYTSKSGPDRLSRKGALLAELAIKEKSIQVVGTHLQAFGKKEIMYAQYQQLFDELLKPTERACIPQIICGDFNTLKKIPETLPTDLPANFEERIASYEVMIKTLQAQDGDIHGEQQFTMDRPFNDLCTSRKQYRLLLDYFLIRNNESSAYIHQRKIIISKYPWHKKYSDLSDHYGLTAIVKGFN